ncbi:hypothetical protein BOTBODRAFT_25900 [Botryobasidium botryosum FD-172 SS1]|uniref:Uncharacterized protein n=1 Tax=Botryobasidium botryosum (strain FD-172 SS1) TaxID=930990 RepID=A0A067N3B8_BOTB1|nr:hypothetical protein BOTBODRAFT_25900 [Botryobasidium botryosum FD-172 SS1]
MSRRLGEYGPTVSKLQAGCTPSRIGGENWLRRWEPSLLTFHNHAHASYSTYNIPSASFSVPFPIIFYMQKPWLSVPLVICASVRNLIPRAHLGRPLLSIRPTHDRHSCNACGSCLGGGGPGFAKGETKMVNLEDGVMQTWKRGRSPSAPITEAEEDGLRAAVRRVLRIEDPMFKLLVARTCSHPSVLLLKWSERALGPDIYEVGWLMGIPRGKV